MLAPTAAVVAVEVSLSIPPAILLLWPEAGVGTVMILLGAIISMRQPPPRVLHPFTAFPVESMARVALSPYMVRVTLPPLNGEVQPGEALCPDPSGMANRKQFPPIKTMLAFMLKEASAT
jgi:hypothetical protein